MKITLLGQPKSTQHCYLYTARAGRVQGYMKAECKTLKEDYQWQARAQVFGEPFKCDLAITLNLYHGTKRKFDIDNANKLIFDALTGIVYEDDSQIVELTIRKSYDKERPRAELQIFPSVIHSVTV